MKKTKYTRHCKLVKSSHAILNFYHEFIMDNTKLIAFKFEEVPDNKYIINKDLVMNSLASYKSRLESQDKEVNRIRLNLLANTVLAYLSPAKWENFLYDIIKINEDLGTVNRETYSLYYYFKRDKSTLEFYQTEKLLAKEIAKLQSFLALVK